MPAPPVASSVARARASCRAPPRSKNRTPRTAPSSTTRSVTSAWLIVVTDGRLETRSQRTRPISRPVASPAWSTRRTLCAASRPSDEPAVGIAIEPRAHAEQFADVADAVLDQRGDGGFVAQAVARAQRVGRVQRRAVVVADGRGDAALRVAGVALGRIGLGQDEHAAGRRERDRRAQAGDAAADDDEVDEVREIAGH